MATGQSPFSLGSAGASAEAIRIANYGAAGAAGAPGALSQAGGWLSRNPALAIGAGALGMQAFGGTSTGTAPSGKIELTEKGKQLETSLYESIKSNLFPENLASRFIGDARKFEQSRRRASERSFAGAGYRGPENVVSGNVARGMLSETATRLGGAGAGERKAGEARRTFELNRFADMQNFMNLQTQTPVLRAQADIFGKEQAQYEAAQRGSALGGLAQLAALSAVMKPKQT